MASQKLTLVLFLLFLGIFPKPEAFAQYSATKVKTGVADANTANLSAEPKSIIDRSDRLIAGEKQGLQRPDVTPEWRLGYCFEAWFIMMVQYRSLKQTLSPDEAEACTNCITTFGQKFRKAQKDLNLNDAQMFEALGKNPLIPETYADYWPSLP